ncbi:MAG TPA: hypothetical protein VMB74_02850 [Streptosporangiaceae bacterium]|nr:hypothetical protein [Streptosporangiaceae bacterium]
MKRGRFTNIASRSAVAAASLIVLLVGYAGAASASAAAVTRTDSAAAAPRHVVLNCVGKGQVKPGTITLACADGGIGLSHLHWTSWTPELASAYGTEWENDCTPNCADGHFHYYPVVAVLWGSAAVKGHRGERRYTEATLSYPKGRPPVYAKNCADKIVATHPISQTLILAP